MHARQIFLGVTLVGALTTSALAVVLAGRQPPPAPRRLPAYALSGNTYLVVDQQGLGVLGIGTIMADTTEDGGLQIRTQESLVTHTGPTPTSLTTRHWRYWPSTRRGAYTWTLKTKGRQVRDRVGVDGIGDGTNAATLRHSAGITTIPRAAFLPGIMGPFVLSQRMQLAHVACRESRTAAACADTAGGVYTRLRDMGAVRATLNLETMAVARRDLRECQPRPIPWLAAVLTDTPSPFTCLAITAGATSAPREGSLRAGDRSSSPTGVVSLDAAGRLLHWREMSGLQRFVIPDSVAAVLWTTKRLSLGRALLPTEVATLIGLR